MRIYEFITRDSFLCGGQLLHFEVTLENFVLALVEEFEEVAVQGVFMGLVLRVFVTFWLAWG